MDYKISSTIFTVINQPAAPCPPVQLVKPSPLILSSLT